MEFLLVPFVIVIITMALIIVFKSIKIVPESRVYIIEKLGKYDQSLESGLNFINPFFDRVSRVVSLKEQVVDFPLQPVITRARADNIIPNLFVFIISPL